MGLAQWYPALLSQCSEQLPYVDFRDQVCCGRCLSCTWIIPLVSDHSNNSAQPYCRAGILTEPLWGQQSQKNSNGNHMQSFCPWTGAVFLYGYCHLWRAIFSPLHCKRSPKKAGSDYFSRGWMNYFRCRFSFQCFLTAAIALREVKETAVIALRWLFLKPWRVWQKSIPPIFLILRMTSKEKLCCLVFNIFTKPSQV